MLKPSLSVKSDETGLKCTQCSCLGFTPSSSDENLCATERDDDSGEICGHARQDHRG
jgi:hypothetical protein